MQQISYRLGQYQIVVDFNDSISWQAHGGFGSIKRGRCFINGDILFIGPTEANEEGYLKNEFLENLNKFPKWNRTKYYCSSYTMHICGTGEICNIPGFVSISNSSNQKNSYNSNTKSSDTRKFDFNKQIDVLKKGGNTLVNSFQYIKSSFKKIKLQK